MKILMVSSFLPFPLYSGGHIRLYNILKNLSSKHKVVLVCEKRNYQTEKDVGEVAKVCKKVITVDRKKQWTLDNIIRTGFSSSSFLITGHTNLKMKEEIATFLNNNKFDLIHAETFYIMQNIPKTSVPIVLVEHNIEYLVYKRYANTEALFLRPLLNIDTLKLKKQEEKFWEKANFLVAVSEDEKAMMKNHNKNIAIVPNGVDVERFKIKDLRIKNENKEKTILFIGNFKWVQNRDSLSWIIKKIWPILKLKAKSEKLKVKLWIVGKNIPQKFRGIEGDDIVFDENAPDDTSLIYQKADLLLAPIRVGGGSSYKILEAMASGVPVVTTKLGANPLGAVNNKEIIISEDESEIGDRIIELFSNEQFYKNISSNARKLIEEKYDWKRITQRLEEVYKTVVN